MQKNTILPTLLPTLYVWTQFICIGIILATKPAFAYSTEGILAEISGIFIGFWAVFMMYKQSRLSIFPQVKQGAEMLSTGLYRYIRHPMYLAVLLTTGALVYEYFTFLRLAIWLTLLIVLHLKMNIEEQFLTKYFDHYPSYKEKTSRILPPIY